MLRGILASLALTVVGVAPLAAQQPPGGPPAPLPAEALADAPDMARVAHLSANVVGSGPLAGPMTFAFPQSFYEGRLFLLGEVHGAAAPQVLDLELVRHLSERIGLRDYVAELDPAQAEALNRFLDSGDEAILDRLFSRWNAADSQWGNVAFEAKLRGLRAFNQSLPLARRIRIHGLDAVQDWPLLADELERAGGRVDRAALGRARNAGERAALMAAALTPGTPAVLRRAVDHSAAGLGREETIFLNYAALVRDGSLGGRPAAGLWGLFHILKSPLQAGDLPFAARVVRSDLPTRDRVVSIALLPMESYTQIPVPGPSGLMRLRTRDFGMSGPFVKVAGSASLLRASSPNRIQLFALRGRSSPYTSGADFVSIRASVGESFAARPGAATVDYIDYVGTIRGSDWAAPRPGAGTPWDGSMPPR
jgi:hypothetical protein